MRKLAYFTAFCALFISPARAQLEYTTLDCIFTDGVVTNFDADKYTDKPLRENFTFTFSGFDPANGKVKIIGNAGSSDAFLFESGDRISILEITKTGNLMTTSIGPASASGRMPAFHSRHVWILGKPNISHYNRGSCSRRK